MSTSIYPVRVDASLEPRLSRFLWLVKWALVLPHYVVLVFLWLAFVVLSMVAFFAILFTGRYPRVIFDFNVGVLRWSWRVAYYAYGALGTDRYPPFSLEEVPDYPAHLEVEYPEHLSRGLVLVKWWLLAIPHYLVVAVFLGGGVYLADEASSSEQAPWIWGGGLIGLLVTVAAVVLLFTGRYPRSIFDLVLGMNRWVLRVAAYAGLMTDDYPPFRLDMGPDDPGSPRLRVSAPVAPAPDGGAAYPVAGGGTAYPPAAGVAPTRRPWTAGRVVALTAGSVALVVGGGLAAAGVTLAVADQAVRDPAGFVMTGEQTFESAGYAITTPNLELHVAEGAGWVPQNLLGDAKVEVTGQDAPVFVGVAATADVEAYLAGVAHATVVDFARADGFGGEPVYASSVGGAPAVPPEEVDIWVSSSSGSGTVSAVWAPENGDWTMVVMNADGGAAVAAEVAVGAELPRLDWVAAVLLSAGGTLLVLAAALVVGALRAAAGGERS